MTEGKWSKKKTAVEMTLVAVMRAESRIQNLYFNVKVAGEPINRFWSKEK